MKPERPDPDALLRRVNKTWVDARRAKLKVFFGFAPGVGKTYAMLESARRLRAEGIDVVAGTVETHGRRETAELLAGIEVLPHRISDYRGTRLEELDVDAAIARSPAVLLVDELAHSNAPEGRHKKRWQDVLELLDAGIEVHTTLNVQHIESLNDVVEQVTGVRVRETVPDAMLDRADEIELIDLPPGELLARLHQGKVYVPEQASIAADRFFQRGNLHALRELALRRTADRVDIDMRAYRHDHAIDATWPASERIVVCVGPSPASARLVRAACRMASGLGAPWIAASVDEPARRPFSASERERIDTHLKLAESLGGEAVRLTGTSVAEALIAFARKHNATRIIIGKPTHARLFDRLRGSLLQDVVRGSDEIDVHVISGDDDAEPAPREPRREARPIAWMPYATSSLLTVIATGLASLVRGGLSAPDLVMIYLLVIVLVAMRFGRGPSVLAAALSVAAYDLFFVPPFFTFAVEETRHLLTFTMMFALGILVSGLMLRVRRQAEDARAREQRTATLYALSRELGAAIDRAEVFDGIARHAADAFAARAGVLIIDESGAVVVAASAGELPFGAQEQAVARWVFDHKSPAGLGTDTLPGARLRCLPLLGEGAALAVVAVAPREDGPLAIDDRHFRDAFLRQGALAVERARLADEAKTAALRAKTEEMRSSLLSAVSHDLRTPLAAITGAGTALRDETGRMDTAQRADLIDTICEEAERLERLVGNLLDMTRLESDGMHPKREWVPLEEILGSALTRLEARLSNRTITTDLDPALPLLSVDPVLFEQVVLNLVDNALKYSPAGSPITLRATQEQGALTLAIDDRGQGLPEGAEARVFETFYRGAHPGVGGAGLGLAICRGIVEAHGGTITAANRPDGGASFRVQLPFAGDAPAIDRDAGAGPLEAEVRA